MKEHISHPAQMIFTAAGLAVLIGLTVLYAVMGSWVACAVFLALACLYFWFCRDAFCTVTLDETGVTQRFFWKSQTFKWENIREAGVLAANALRRKQKTKRPSRCAIYYALQPMTNEERLRASLRPSGGCITVTYSDERLRTTIRHWPHTLILFNVRAGDLFGDRVTLLDLNMNEIHY